MVMSVNKNANEKKRLYMNNINILFQYCYQKIKANLACART